MAVVTVGELSLGEVFVGLKVVFDPLDAALIALKAQAEVAIAVVLALKLDLDAAIALADSIRLDIEAAVNALADGLLAAKLSIRAAALVDILAQLEAALSISASLSISDPVLYLSGLVSGLVDVQANLAGLIPTVALGVQVDAALGVILELQGKVAAFDLVLDVLVQLLAVLKAAIGVALNALAQVSATLQVQADAAAQLVIDVGAAIAAVTSPLALAVDLEAQFALGSAAVYRFDGNLEDAGDELDTVLTASPPLGLTTSTPVRAWLIVAPASAIPVVDALTDLIKSVP